MEKLLLVDGSNLLFQMFYGMPARITGAQGQAIQGTLGFVGALLKVIRRLQPTHVAVLFDGETENPRRLLDADYKANRPDYSQLPEEDTPFSQLPDIYAALDHLGICHSETVDCEADDWIAGYARQYGTDREVVILSQDSDFFQLITQRVSVYRYRGARSVLCDSAYITEKLGVDPAQYAAFKSLTGDSADNIAGVPGIGPKTAAALLREYGDLDTLLQQADTIGKPALRATVQASVQRILHNHQLIVLRGAECLPFTMDALSFTDAGVTTTQVLIAIGLKKAPYA